MKDTKKTKVSNKSKSREKEPVLDEDTSGKNESNDDETRSERKETSKKTEERKTQDRTPFIEKGYRFMSLDELVVELEKLLKNENVQAIRKQIESIKSEFNTKFSNHLADAKKRFIDEGGNSIDFSFDFPLKRTFNMLYRRYRERRDAYFKNLEKSLNENLEVRKEIIQEIKNLLNVEENINDTYKQFKALQERWRNSGPIPRDKYNNVWNNYHHHVENFYDFLHLNREFRDKDFKHNLNEKLKIIDRAKQLAEHENINRAFRELQVLHKIWKEELGPVSKEYRDEIWEKFSDATKVIHKKRQEYFANLDRTFEKNLERKNELISKIEEITNETILNHGAWQRSIKIIEELRQSFFDVGRIPKKDNEPTWKKFKDAVRTFNRKKNSFYKNLKKDQYKNLQEKLELIKIAEKNKDSEDFKATTPLMKKIQSDWKKIGHVPRKDSDQIWSQFKDACNHYFNRLYSKDNEDSEEECEAFDKKTAFLDNFKNMELLNNNPIETLAVVRKQLQAWYSFGKVPYNKRFIENKFYKVFKGRLNNLKLDKSEIEILKYELKLISLNDNQDKRSLDNEFTFIRKKMDESKAEINQLENNLQFFSNLDKNNDVVKEVYESIDKHKANFKIWKGKYKIIKKYYL